MRDNKATSLYEMDMFSVHVRRMLALLRHKTLKACLRLHQHVLKTTMKCGTMVFGLETSEIDYMH